MKRLFLFVMVLALVLPHGNFADVQADDTAAKILNFDEVMQKAVDGDTVRVIVTLEVPDVKALTAASTQFKVGDMSVAAAQEAVSADAALASQIATTVDAVLNGLDSNAFEVVHSYKSIPAMALRVSPEGLIALAEAGEVQQIVEDIPELPSLADTIPLVGADDAWASGYSGSGWYVAILDTGLRTTHEFFAGKSILEACYTDFDCPGGTDSAVGPGSAVPHPASYAGYDHGTHVAGISAGNNGSLYGVARDADLIAVQVFSITGPTDIGSYPSDQIAGLEYVYSLRMTYNIASVNISIGGGRYYSQCDATQAARKLAIDNLLTAGIATAIASGNQGYCDSVNAPGCISTAVTVGSTTKTDFESSFNNWHPTMLDLFAPGSSINSATAASDTSYGLKSGTSMAAPHVAGAFAVLRSVDPTSPVSTLLTALTTTGVVVTTPCPDGGTLPRIQIELAVAQLSTPSPPSGLAANTISASQINLSWTDNANNETGFKIERKTGSGGTYSQIITVGTNVTSYNNTSGLSEGTQYYYRVRATNATGDSVYSNEANAITMLATPTGLAASAISETEIDLTWNNISSSESGYYIERKTGSGGTYSQIASLAANSTSYSDSSLTKATTYYYRVLCWAAGGLLSEYSSEASATTQGTIASRDSKSGTCFITAADF